MVTRLPPISVALPVTRGADTLPRAFKSVVGQDHPDIEILVVLNGADRDTASMAGRLVDAEPRARILHLARPSLPAALNVALRAARHDLIARMDADDRCPPQRLRLQAQAMRDRPAWGGVGCAWQLEDAEGRVLSTVRPPEDPADLRWRLLLGNILAHGSMMLRRQAVIAAGAYNELLDRAQDYDLWLRLLQVAPIGALPDVLYTHVTSHARDPGRSTPDQAGHAARAMLGAWRSLGEGTAHLDGAVAAALTRQAGPDGALQRIEALLRRAPTRDALMAWLWASWNAPAADRHAYDAARGALLRETGDRLRADGVDRVWLWGAGDHTRWLLDHQEDLDLDVAGIVDDHAAGERRFGFPVESPSVLSPSDVVLISSDWHESTIWESSRAAQARGVRVVRLYADARARGARSASVSTRSCA